TVARNGNSYFTEVAVTTTGVVYATLSDDGTQRGIWRSPNGTTWTKIIPPNLDSAYNRIVIGINPNNENEVYFLANTPGFGKEVVDFVGTSHWNSLWKYTYLSGDGDSLSGGTWLDLSANLPVSGGIFDKFHTQDSYDMFVKVKPGNSNIVFLGGTNLYRSDTAFLDSTQTTYMGGYEKGSALPVIASYLDHHPDQHCLEFFPSNPDIMINANDGGMFKTLDNTKDTTIWIPLNNGYVTSMFYTVAIDHGSANNDVIIGGAQDNGTWWTNNNTLTSPWKHVHGGDGAYCQIADNGTSYYFAIQNLSRLVKSTLDINGNETAFNAIDPIGGKGYLWMNPYILDPNNNNIMYLAGGKYLWRNDDLSTIPMNNSWDSISTNWIQYLDSVPTANSKITALAVSKTPANRVYYGTDKQKVYRVDNANIGTQVPVNITPTTGTTLFPAAGYVSCVAVDPQDADKIMVIFSNYSLYSIFYSADGGTTWAKAGGNLETTNIASPSIRWASIMHVSDGVVYLVGTSVGLFATDTLMGISTVWVQQGTNTIGNAVCDMIETRESDGLVVVATHANGMFSSNITSVADIVSIKELTEAKADFELKNYPNPLSQNTTIEFTLAKKAFVNLQVWDEYGRLIETLKNENMQAGKQTVNFDAKNLRAGVYYYSLTVDKGRKTNRMVVVK
ncbi:MAG: T9SS type A sorting domain-containing protein, partial [Bacteroidia bacterium]|nr:T9SS type A sorting domain-containing protein [Bacteroidia bacterium]